MKPYYDQDGITIYHGDCREVLPEMPATDLVLTDPPYGVKIGDWDTDIPDPRDWLYPLFGKTRTVLVTPGNGNLFAYPKPKWVMAWFRPGSVQRARNGRFSHWEPILVYGEYKFPVDSRAIPANTHNKGIDHPCPKPMMLFKWLIGESQTTGLVLDPFVGSGTTLEAAKDLGRSAIGIEIEERYCEVAAKRLSQQVMNFATP